MKRLFDVTIALLGLLIAAPVMAVIAVLIKLESRGPVLYKCARVGQRARVFGMLKFRTMIENADAVDCSLCKANDVRVTSFGMFLRRTKLNELPQLFNVLMGDMAVVGPRPEDPKFIRYYVQDWNIVLSVRPGIVGLNQILHRNEEDLLQGAADPETYYVQNLLPEKLKRDIRYVHEQTLWGDFKILLHAVYATVFKGFRLIPLRARLRAMGLMSVDVALSLLAYVAANLIRHETLPYFEGAWVSYAIILISNPFIFRFLGLYRCSLRFFSVPDMVLLGKVALVSAGCLVTSNYLLMSAPAHSRIVYALYPAIMFLLIGAARVLLRSLLESRERRNEKPTSSRVLIYGAGRLGVETLKRLQFQPGIEVAGFIDDDPRIKGQSILGTAVLGSGLDLPHLKALYDVDSVVISFMPVKRGDFDNARRNCLQAEISDCVSPAILWDLPRNHSYPNESLEPRAESPSLSKIAASRGPNPAMTEQDSGQFRITG